MTPHAESPARPTATGMADALADLENLHEVRTADHVARFAAMHNSLTAALSSIDDV